VQCDLRMDPWKGHSGGQDGHSRGTVKERVDWEVRREAFLHFRGVYGWHGNFWYLVDIEYGFSHRLLGRYSDCNQMCNS